jgi:putative ABC transport system substrate-binding protein
MAMLGGTAVAGTRSAFAQTPGRTFRLGTLTPSVPIAADSPNGKTLLSALAAHGYTPGRNLTYEAKASGGTNTRLPKLLDEFKASGVDALVTVGYPATLASKASGIPTVVAAGAGDPVATHLIESLAHPGGNVTGISDVAEVLSVKRLSLLKELLPNLKRVAMLWNRDDLGMSLRYEASAEAAQGMGVAVQALGVREPDDFDGVFEAMDREPPDAILMVSDALTNLNRKRVFSYAAAKRLPAIYESDPLVRDGGLMSYGADQKESFERAAALVDRVFRGAKPSDLPFEEPTRYLFVVNLKTAKDLGLVLPPTLLARADDVIE